MKTSKNEKSGYELVDAVMKNDTARARELLEGGADANMTTFTAGREISAMDLAESHPNPEMVKLLKTYHAKNTAEGEV
jgi:hypothetical protein